MYVELPEVPPHPRADLLRRFPAARLARALKISTGHLYGILRGTNQPSKELENRIEMFLNERENTIETQL